MVIKKKLHLFLEFGYWCQIKGEKWKKKDNENIPLNISKIFGTIFDHWLDVIKAHN